MGMRVFLAAALLATLAPGSIPQDAPFRLQAGDVVVFAGPGNLDEAQWDGTLEALLALRFAEQKPRFRTMAWTGDTVDRQWEEHWHEVKAADWTPHLEKAGADVLIAGFGRMESLAGRAGLPAFRRDYARFLDGISRTVPRIVLLSPLPFERPLASHAPDLSKRNDDVRAYAEAVRALAAERRHRFVDLFTGGTGKNRLTEDGIHLTPQGHADVAHLVARRLGVKIGNADRLPAVRRAVRAKNRLWFHSWRPMNWAFAYGDRTHVAFPKGTPPLPGELKEFSPLIRRADAAVHEAALGRQATIETPEPKRDPEPGITSAEEQASFTLREGFTVNLFASEADGIRNPVQMRWDEKGRLWVICIPTYPHVRPGEEPRDYILVCEDTDGDHRADRFTRFAEGLYLPLGLEHGDGGLYVCENTRLLHLKDTDGDGKADQRRIVLSGFGTGDSHQLINAPIWGPGGRLWFTQGHHAYSRVETPWGIERLDKAGLWRFHPRRLRLDAFFNRSTAGANCWGVAFDDWGQVYHNTGAQFAAYFTLPGMIRTRRPRKYIELFKGNKNTTIDIVGTRHFPDDLQGVVVFGGFYNNTIPLYRPHDDGSGVRTERLPDLMASSRKEFRPVDVRFGPDGALYACDWYNEIIGHYQASYRDPRRDHSHGRIWRIAAKDRDPIRPPDLGSMSERELLDQLKSPERWVRYQARRLLFGRSPENVLKAVDAWVRSLDPDDEETERLLVRALGMYEAFEAVRPEFLKKLLEADNPRARAYATRVIGMWSDRLEAPLDLLKARIADPDPRVRLEAVVASSYVAAPEAVEVAARALDAPHDRFLDYALRQAVDALKPHWNPAFAAGRLTFNGSAEHLAFVLQADGTKDVVARVRALAESPELEAVARENLRVLLVNVGNPDDLRTVFDRAGSSIRVMDELAVVARVRGARPSGDLEPPLRKRMTDGPADARAAAVRLVGAWRLKTLSSEIRTLLGPETADPIRAAALVSLVRLEGKDSVRIVEPFSAAGRPRALRAAAIAALVEVDLPRAADRAAAWIPDAKDQEEMAATVTPFLGRTGGMEALARALSPRALGADPAKLLSRVVSTAGRNAPELTAVLARAVGASAKTPDYSDEFVRTLAAEVRGHGDAPRGRTVYDARIANCAACHRIAGTGGTVGPELTSVGTALPVDKIIEAILWPKRQVKEGYLSTVVLTTDGEIIQGYKVQESGKELAIRDAAKNRVVRIPRKRIQAVRDGGTLMPDGLTVGMTREELRDLVRFLSELGRRSKK